MTDKNEVYAIVKTSVSDTYSHVYIDFYSDLESEVDTAVKNNDIPFNGFGDLYQYIGLKNQYGTGGIGQPVTDSYAYALAATMNEANVFEMEGTAKLLKRLTNRLNKIRTTTDKEYSDEYLNYVSNAFKAMKVKRAVLVGDYSKLTWYEPAMSAVKTANTYVKDEMQNRGIV